MKHVNEYIEQIDGELWLKEMDRGNLAIDYKIKEILYEATSPFQHVMVVDSYDFGNMLVLDGAVQTTDMDGFIYNEMIAHIPLTHHPSPKRVLIIGGGDCGVVQEVSKYPHVEHIDMVEIDELVVEACQTYMPKTAGSSFDSRVNFIFTDGVEYARQKADGYDVIIVDSSDPVGPAVQLFELDFYRNLHRALNEDGIMVCQSQSPIFQQDIMRQSYERISSLFQQTALYTAVVPSYPGGLWSYTLGSKINLSSGAHARARFDKQTRYVNEGIIDSCFTLPQFVADALFAPRE